MLKQVDRSATFSFCQNAPFLATGSVAGAIDLSFSTSSQLEIFSLDFASTDKDLKLAGAPVQAPERFARLAWGAPGADRAAYPYGLLAGGLADGSVCIWNPARIIGQPAAPDGRGQLLCRLQKHQGAVRGLEFNPFASNLLASGAADGELCIWDVANPAQPSLYPAMKGASGGGAPGSDITCLAWNRKVQHILGTATVGGTVAVWDLKKQRPVISFKDPNGRRRCSALAWNPEVATQLVVASDDDASPALQLWDLRNSVSPLMELHGHSKGVVALSWCPQDAGLLLSSGKDNRVMVWDVPAGTVHSELPPAANWKFDVQWAPGKSAGVFAGATFEGAVTLDTLGACQPPGMDPATGYQPPRSTRAPAWTRRPAGATFGFGGKLVSFKNSKRQLPTGEVGETASVEVRQVSVDTGVPAISPEFEAVIRSADRGTLRTLCESRAAAATAAGNAQEADTWAFLQTHFEADGRQHLLERLGFADALPKPAAPEEAEPEPAAPVDHAHVDVATAGMAGMSLEQQVAAAALLSGAPGDDGSAFFAQSPVDGGAFFDNLNTPKDGLSPRVDPSPKAGAAAAGGAPVSPPPPAERPIVDGPPGEGEDEINAAVLVSNFAGAVDAALKHGRHADALIAASLAGGDAFERARKEYMAAHPRPFMRVLHAVLSGDWAAYVASRPPTAWRQTLAALLTSAPYDQFETLVGSLANRLSAAGIAHAAVLCHVCAGDVEAAVRVWTKSAGPDASPAAKEAVMEKAVVLGLGVDRAGASSALGDLLARHAEALAANGHLSAAYDLLTLVPGDSTTGSAAELRDRLYRSGAAVSAAPAAAAVAAPAAPAPVAASGYATYGQPQQQMHMQQMQQPKPPTPTYGGGFSPQTFQPAPPPTQPPPQQQQQPNGYGTMPAPPTVFQPAQPAGPPGGMGMAGGYGGPPTGPPPTAFAPTAPPPQAAAPPPPTVYQQHQQPQQLSPRGGMMGAPAPAAPPPTVFQPSAAPPAGAAPPMGPPPSAFAPSAPPPLAVPPTPSHSVYQPSPAPTPAAPPPTVYQPPSAAPGAAAGFGAYGSGAMGVLSPRSSMAAPMPAAAAPPPPPPRGPPADISIATADTSAVAPELRGVVGTLGGLYRACEGAYGAHPVRARELSDASKKLGALFWKLNEGEVSPSVGGKLAQLCAALDAGDYATAGHVQVQLTTADWDECAAWLTALKRLIKMRQTG